MFELKISTHFSSAHRILEHTGKCEKLHGHNWNVDLTVRTAELNAIGLAVDFADLKKILKDVVEPLDHVYLNELPQFSTVASNPTAENVSFYIYNQVRGL